MFFDENGMFRLDEAVAGQPTFKKIMEDGIVTDDELEEQANRIIGLLKEIEAAFSPEQVKKVEELLTEASVLYAAAKQKELQELFK